MTRNKFHNILQYCQSKFNTQATLICTNRTVIFKSEWYLQVLDENTEVEDDGGKKVSALLVFTEAIRYLRNHLLSDLKKRNLDVPDNQIKWVLTVPAIWSDPAKQFMRTAAERVRIFIFLQGFKVLWEIY